jgi:hypothetical protein
MVLFMQKVIQEKGQLWNKDYVAIKVYSTEIWGSKLYIKYCLLRGDYECHGSFQ